MPALEEGHVLSRVEKKRLPKEVNKILERSAGQSTVRLWVITGAHKESSNKEGKEMASRLLEMGRQLDRQGEDHSRLYLIELEKEKIRKYLKEEQK